MVNCEVCGVEIDSDRLEVFPNTTCCPKHSGVQKKVCFMEYGHKTAPSLVTIDSGDRESIRKATRAFRRSR